MTSHNCGSQFNSLRTCKAAASLPEAGPEIIRAGDPEGNSQVQWGEPGPTDTCKEDWKEKGQEPTSPPHSPTQMILLTCIRAEHASGPGIRGAGGGDQGLEEPQALRWPGGQGTERGNPEDPGCRGPAAVPFQKGELSEMVPSALYQPSECIHAHTHSKSHAQGLSGPRPLMAHTNVQLCQEDFWEM